MNQKYFFIFFFLFSFGCSNTQSSLKNQFKTFFSHKSSKIGMSVLSIAAAAILAKKFYAKKNSRKNNPPFKNNGLSPNNTSTKQEKAPWDTEEEYTDENGDTKKKKVNLKSKFQRLYFVIIDYIRRQCNCCYKIKSNYKIPDKQYSSQNEFYFLIKKRHYLLHERYYTWNNITHDKNQFWDQNVLFPFNAYINKIGIIQDFNFRTSSLIEAYKKYNVYNTLIIFLNSESLDIENINQQIKKFNDEIKNGIIYFLLNKNFGFNTMKSNLNFSSEFDLKKEDTMKIPFYKINNHKLILDDGFNTDFKFIRDYKEISSFEKIEFKEMHGYNNTKDITFYIQKEWNPQYYSTDEKYYYYPFGLPYDRKYHTTIETASPVVHIKKQEINENKILEDYEKETIINQAKMLMYINISCYIKTNQDINLTDFINDINVNNYLKVLLKEVLSLLEIHEIKFIDVTIVPLIYRQLNEHDRIAIFNQLYQKRFLETAITYLKNAFNPAPVPLEAEQVQPEAQPQPIEHELHEAINQ